MPDPNFLPAEPPPPELLAGYVLGDLTAEEIAIVEAHLARHPEQQDEVAKLRLSLDLLPMTLPASQPPPSLRERIVNAAATDRASAPTLAPQRRSSWIAAITGLGLLLIGGLAWNNYRLDRELTALGTELQIARSQIATRSSATPDLAGLLSQSNNRLIPLKNLPGQSGGGSLAIVPSKSVALLALQQVKPLPPGMVYRVWAIQNNEEMDCAHFVPDAEGKVLMKIPLDGWQKARKIEITIERQAATTAEGEIAIEGEV